MKHSKLYACLSYLSILIIIPALIPGKDSFVRFHLNQGLVLLIANIVFGCISFIPHMTLIGDLLNCVVLILPLWESYLSFRDRSGNFLLLEESG